MVATLNSLRQLRYLVALADQLSFTRAAAGCHVTQSTLSAGLKELEELLGSRLVERDRQTVLMTPIGQEVVRRAREILTATQDLVETATATQQPLTGLLRLGVIPTIAPFLLPPIMSALQRRYPELRLALREDQSASLFSRLDAGQLDLALIALPIDTGKLLVESLFDDELWVVGPKADPQLKHKTVNVTDALTERLLLLEEGHCLRDHSLYACGASATSAAERVEATSLLTLVQMVNSGLGVALVPAMALKSGLISGISVVARPMAKPHPKRTIALVARHTTTRLADLQALAALIRSLDRR